MKYRIYIRYRNLKTKAPVEPKAVFHILYWVWPITGGLIPIGLLYIVFSFGSPALLFSYGEGFCSYIDLLGVTEIYTGNGQMCQWYAFRKVEIDFKEITHFIEGIIND